MNVSFILHLCTLVVSTIASPARAAGDYSLGPDSARQSGVPESEVTKFSLRDSRVDTITWNEFGIRI